MFCFLNKTSCFIDLLLEPCKFLPKYKTKLNWNEKKTILPQNETNESTYLASWWLNTQEIISSDFKT